MEEKTTSRLPGWRIIRTIGKGSFGCVYEVEKEDEFGGSIRSALKVISIPETSAEIEAYRDDGYDDESLTELYKSRVEDITSEFRLMNKLKGCSNIVSYEDHMIVRHDHDIGYDIMIRMELLTPLPKFFEQQLGSAADEKTVRKLGADICRALERCSRHNIIHRDIKPQNIFVNEEGDFKLGDFGIAKTSDHTTKATKTGTYGYMAPEVYLSKPYNASVDLYSLGLVLYWMLNERRGPFLPLPPAVPRPNQSAEALERRMHGEPLPAPMHGSEELKRIVLKACAYDPKDRYASPAEMRQDLEGTLAAAIPVVPIALQQEKTETPAESEMTISARSFVTVPMGDGFRARTGRSIFCPFCGQKQSIDKEFCEYCGKPIHAAKTPTFVPIFAESPFVKGTVPVNGTIKSPRGSETDKQNVGEETVALFKQKGTKPETMPQVKKPEPKPEPFRTETKPETPIDNTAKKKKKLFLPILSVAAALVVATVVLIFVLSGKGDSSEQAIAQAAAEPTAIPTDTPKPTEKPTPEPTEAQTPEPMEEPTPESTRNLDVEHTVEPTSETTADSTATVDNEEWSKWAESLPSYVNDKDYFIETQTLYSSRSLEQKASTTQIDAEGWYLYDTNVSYGEYGPWSDWSQTYQSASNIREVNTRNEYRYRNKEQMTSSNPSLDGWVLEDTVTSWGEYSAWSAWATEAVTASESRQVESKTQYSYRTKSYTTSSSSSLSGWILYDHSVSYGAWSAWQDSSISPSNEIDVDTRQVKTGTEYHMAHYCTGNVSGAKYQTAPSNHTTNEVFNQHCIFHDLGWFNSLDDFYPYETEYLYKGSSTSTCYRCSNSCFRWYIISQHDNYKTQYRYRRIYHTYYYYKWSDWSNWSDSYVAADSATDVKTRVLYRYRDRQKNTTYVYYRWGEWSDWTADLVLETSTRQVQKAVFYRYRDREIITTYYYRRWTEWSDYSTKRITESETTEVRKKNRYRYKKR